MLIEMIKSEFNLNNIIRRNLSIKTIQIFTCGVKSKSLF